MEKHESRDRKALQNDHLPEINVEQILTEKSGKVDSFPRGSAKAANHKNRMQLIRTDPEYQSMRENFPAFTLENDINLGRMWAKRRKKGIICDGGIELISEYFRIGFPEHNDLEIDFPATLRGFLDKFDTIKERAMSVLEACVKDRVDYRY